MGDEARARRLGGGGRPRGRPPPPRGRGPPPRPAGCVRVGGEGRRARHHRRGAPSSRRRRGSGGTILLGAHGDVGVGAALEEVVFRGFLLASLTKWLPTPGAVLFSRWFSRVRTSRRGFPATRHARDGAGFSYARTRNLLTPMFIHSLWNSGVLIVVSVLVSSGRTDLLPGLGGGRAAPFRVH